MKRIRDRRRSEREVSPVESGREGGKVKRGNTASCCQTMSVVRSRDGLLKATASEAWEVGRMSWSFFFSSQEVSLFSVKF